MTWRKIYFIISGSEDAHPRIHSVSLARSTQFSSFLHVISPRNKDFLLFALVTRFSLEGRKLGKKMYRSKLYLIARLFSTGCILFFWIWYTRICARVKYKIRLYYISLLNYKIKSENINSVIFDRDVLNFEFIYLKNYFGKIICKSIEKNYIFLLFNLLNVYITYFRENGKIFKLVFFDRI